jgi:hypothetical protein
MQLCQLYASESNETESCNYGQDKEVDTDAIGVYALTVRDAAQ